MERICSRTAIPGFDGYFADIEGRIYTNKKVQGWPLDDDGFRRLKPSISVYGYAIYRLNTEGQVHNLSGHKLVLLTFVGPPPQGMLACHYNGVRLDNRVCNLRWDTPKGNAADAIRHGTMCKGEKCGQAKLTSEQVVMIRYKRNLGATLVSLAAEFKVNHSTIRRITTGRSWQCVPDGISAPVGQHRKRTAGQLRWVYCESVACGYTTKIHPKHCYCHDEIAVSCTCTWGRCPVCMRPLCTSSFTKRRLLPKRAPNSGSFAPGFDIRRAHAAKES